MNAFRITTEDRRELALLGDSMKFGVKLAVSVAAIGLIGLVAFTGFGFMLMPFVIPKVLDGIWKE